MQFPGPPPGYGVPGGPCRARGHFFPEERGRHECRGAARFRLGCGKLACVATVRVHGNGTGPYRIWLPPCLCVHWMAAVAASLACVRSERGRSRCMARAAGLGCGDEHWILSVPQPRVSGLDVSDSALLATLLREAPSASPSSVPTSASAGSTRPWPGSTVSTWKPPRPAALPGVARHARVPGRVGRASRARRRPAPVRVEPAG